MKKILLFICIISFFISCKNKYEKTATFIVNEWTNRIIKNIPNNKYIIYTGDTTKCYKISNWKYAIISYIDEKEAKSCKLHLFDWARFIHELDSITGGNVHCLLIVNVQNKREFIHTLKEYGFDFPIYIDDNDSFNKVNNFPSDIAFHTFLIDKYNKVLFIGNPINNFKIKESYMNIIRGENIIKNNIEPSVTRAIISTNKVNFGHISYLNTRNYNITLTNVGNSALYIQYIKTSCGCINVEYIKSPILYGKTNLIHIKYKAVSKGAFNKSIKIYCNTVNSPFYINIIGFVE